jgi:hypothetical protein
VVSVHLSTYCLLFKIKRQISIKWKLEGRGITIRIGEQIWFWFISA